MELIDTSEKIYENVSNLIEAHNIKFDVKIVTDIESHLDEIVDFINKNYMDKDKGFSLIDVLIMMNYVI